MPFKTKEEMFGDGAGFGTQVPVSTANPAGYASGNRGIGFGEQLTSAVANRTHYALALNDEDLNDRIVVFETEGLDAAYDLGSIGSTGGGRFITKDGGAVETISLLATGYADDPSNAHFRANATNDTAAISTGFDFASGSDGAHNGFAGFLDRRAVSFAEATVTEFDFEEPAELNPGGAGGDIIQLTAASKRYRSTAGSSLLLVGVDLIEVIGGSGPGLYYIHALGPTDEAVRVRGLDGSTPVFSPDDPVTVRHYRPAFVTAGPSSARTTIRGSVLTAQPGQDSALDILPGQAGIGDVGGSDIALRVRRSGSDGSPLDALVVDALGRISIPAPQSGAETEVPRLEITSRAGSNYILIEEVIWPGRPFRLRRYAYDAGFGSIVFVATLNARWDVGSGTWVRDDPGFSWLRETDTGGDQFFVRPSVESDGWTDDRDDPAGWQYHRQTVTQRVPLSSVISEAEDAAVKWDLTAISGYILQSRFDFGAAFFPINSLLRQHDLIRAVRFRVLLGSAHGSPGDRFSCSLSYSAHSFSATSATPLTVVEQGDSGGATGWTTIDPLTSDHSVDDLNREYVLTVRASADGGSTPDYVAGIELEVDRVAGMPQPLV